MSTPGEPKKSASPMVAPGTGHGDPSTDTARLGGTHRGIRILRLRLKGINRDYEVDFRTREGGDPRPLSLIAGAFSTGKTSVLEFIAYCLGARNHPQHPEILRAGSGRRRLKWNLVDTPMSSNGLSVNRQLSDSSERGISVKSTGRRWRDGSSNLQATR